MKTSLWNIFKIFFIIGAQLLGGGYVILPLLKKYIVEERNWITETELVDYFAVSQCLPGIIATNIAVFSGFKLRGYTGAIFSLIGLIAPSFIAILLIANMITNFADNKIIQDAFWGIRISVVILVIMTIKDMWKVSVNSKYTYFIFVTVLLLMLFFNLSPTFCHFYCFNFKQSKGGKRCLNYIFYFLMSFLK